MVVACGSTWQFLDSCVEQTWGSHQCAVLKVPTHKSTELRWREEDFPLCSAQGLTRGFGALFSFVIPSNTVIL